MPLAKPPPAAAGPRSAYADDMRRPFSASDVLRLWEGLPPLDDAFRGFLVAHALPAGEPNTPAVVGGLRWLGAPRGICVGEATVHRVDPSRVVDTFRKEAVQCRALGVGPWWPLQGWSPHPRHHRCSKVRPLSLVLTFNRDEGVQAPGALKRPSGFTVPMPSQ